MSDANRDNAVPQRHTEAQTSPPPEPPPPPSSPDRGRVLLVEDNFLLSLTLASVVGSTGCRVLGPVPSVNAALDAARNTDIAAAVLDFKVVGGNTVEVARLLRSRNIPVLYVTAYNLPHMLPDDLQGLPCLSKPVDGTELARWLNQHVKA